LSNPHRWVGGTNRHLQRSVTFYDIVTALTDHHVATGTTGPAKLSCERTGKLATVDKKIQAATG